MPSSKISLLNTRLFAKLNTRLFAKFASAFFAFLFIFLLAFPIGFYGMALYLEPNLPSVQELKSAERQMPLQIYSNDGKLIAHYGGRMSLPVSYDEIPEHMIQAFLAAEDEYFFEHSGISVKGLGRAITQLVTNDATQTGGSTITMQVAKNYFLTPEQTFKRKLTELFLSRKIEEKLTKDEILTLYVNKIYLGKGAYGVQAAAKKYYSKSLKDLSIAEMAMIAGLPKAPSEYNPVVNPNRALQRRNWILKRMKNLNYISEEEYSLAVDSPIGLNLYKETVDDVDMPYLAEMARISLVKQFGSEVMNSGWRVRLTVNSNVQHTADEIVRKHLYRYDRYRGWRGVEANGKPLSQFNSFLNVHPVKILDVGKKSAKAKMKTGEIITIPWSGMRWLRKYYNANASGGYYRNPAQILKKDDIVYVKPLGNSWQIAKIPKVQGSLVSINPDNGAIIALVGGFHFKYSKFNRATDAWRQPGSTIKPLIYSAALEKGYRPTSLINDSPLRIGNWRPKNSDGRYYGPMTLRRALYLSRNLVSIRLLQSIGIANARSLLEQFGLDKDKLPTTLSLALGAGKASPLQMATAYATFANGGHRIQPYLIEQIYDFNNNLLYQANPKLACAVCFNDNLKEFNKKQRKKLKELKEKLSDPSYENMGIDELESELNKNEIDITDKSKKKKNKDKDKNTKKKGDKEDEGIIDLTNKSKDKKKKDDKEAEDEEKTDVTPRADRLIIYPVEYQRAEQAPRILSPSVAYEMAGILRDVIQRGTAVRARALGRYDIGGKTGTTNNFRDAWFAGFQPTNATVVWIGFDQPATLGYRQYGGRLALPVWMDYMRFALRGVPYQWVTLGNNAKSKKEKAKTIDLTDKSKLGDKKDDKSEEKEKPKVEKPPVGELHRRRAPPPVIPYYPSSILSND